LGSGFDQEAQPDGVDRFVEPRVRDLSLKELRSLLQIILSVTPLLPVGNIWSFNPRLLSGAGDDSVAAKEGEMAKSKESPVDDQGNDAGS
jgi:hypothetical protein